MTILPKAIHRFNAIAIKLPIVSFIELEQIILNFVCKRKRPSNNQKILRKNRARGIMFPDFILCYKPKLKQYGTEKKKQT